MTPETRGRPQKAARGRAWARIKEELLQEISVHCEANAIDRSDALGAALESWWLSPANAKNRAAVRDYLSKKPKLQEAK